jgi:hypothetical protein
VELALLKQWSANQTVFVLGFREKIACASMPWWQVRMQKYNKVNGKET